MDLSLSIASHSSPHCIGITFAFYRSTISTRFAQQQTEVVVVDGEGGVGDNVICGGVDGTSGNVLLGNW